MTGAKIRCRYIVFTVHWWLCFRIQWIMTCFANSPRLWASNWLEENRHCTNHHLLLLSMIQPCMLWKISPFSAVHFREMSALTVKWQIEWPKPTLPFVLPYCSRLWKKIGVKLSTKLCLQSCGHTYPAVCSWDIDHVFQTQEADRPVPYEMDFEHCGFCEESSHGCNGNFYQDSAQMVGTHGT